MGFRGGRFAYGPMRMPRGAPRFMFGRIMKRGFMQRRPFEVRCFRNFVFCLQHYLKKLQMLSIIACWQGCSRLSPMRYDSGMFWVRGPLLLSTKKWFRLHQCICKCGKKIKDDRFITLEAWLPLYFVKLGEVGLTRLRFLKQKASC